MISEENKIILQAAISKYGAHKQMDMAVEECAELIQAINKCKRGEMVGLYSIEPPLSDLKLTQVFFNFCGEIADVKIMIAQLELMLPEAGQKAVQLSFERKIGRLSERMNQD